jgi:hypothetical protein
VPCCNEFTGQHTQVRLDAACPAIAPIKNGYAHRTSQVGDYETDAHDLSCRGGQLMLIAGLPTRPCKSVRAGAALIAERVVRCDTQP